MDASECPHNQHGLCQVATRLAGIPVPIADDACHACLQQKSPCTINRVTCSKAIQIRLAAGMPAPQELLDCVRPPESGVGTELERMIDTTRQWLHMLRLDWIIPQPVACGCGPIRAAMNYDSPQQCLQKRAFYARNIANSWISFLPALRFMPLKQQLINCYLRLAIQRVMRKESN